MNQLENFPFVIVIVDKKGVIRSCNDKIKDMYGYNKSDILGKNFRDLDLIYEPDVPLALETLSQLRIGKIPDVVVLKAKKKDGSCLTTRMQFQIINIDGEEMFQVIAQDETVYQQTKRKISESESKFRNIFENNVGGIVIIDQDRKIVDVNQMTCQVTDYEKEDLIGEMCDIICPKGSNSKKYAIWEKGDMSFSEMETTIKCKDGTKIPVIKNARTITIDGNQYIIENFQDISNYKEMFKRSEFYKDLITHDITNILHGIQNAVEISEKKVTSPPKFMQDILSIVKEEISRGSKLLKNIGVLSKLEKNTDAKRKINVVSLIKGLTNHKMEIDKEKIMIKGNNEFVQAGDLLENVFINLIDNAFRHNDSDQPFLKIIVQQIADSVSIKFIDNGYGIPDEMKETIFNRGYKSNKSTMGMGIGLSLVKKILSHYGGEISCSNRIEGDHSQGSVFTVTLPSC